MFTLRAHQHGNDEGHGYVTFSAARYEVVRNDDRKLVALFTEDSEVAEAKRVLSVGRQPGGIFDVIFVMNAAGKTVDTIR